MLNLECALLINNVLSVLSNQNSCINKHECMITHRHQFVQIKTAALTNTNAWLRIAVSLFKSKQLHWQTRMHEAESEMYRLSTVFSKASSFSLICTPFLSRSVALFISVLCFLDPRTTCEFSPKQTTFVMLLPYAYTHPDLRAALFIKTRIPDPHTTPTDLSCPLPHLYFPAASRFTGFENPSPQTDMTESSTIFAPCIC